MTREDYFNEKRNAAAERYHAKHQKFYTNPSHARTEPFQMADQLYYVGDKNVCIHLVDTGDGLVLLDSGYLGSDHLLIDSIWRAGFDPENVRYIIHSHGHSDHFGASSEFKNMFGTKLVMSRIDAEKLKQKGDAAIPKAFYPNHKVPEMDLVFEDGDVFTVGNTSFRFVLTPGHTAGVFSIFFDVTYEGKTYLAGMYGGAGVNAITLPYLWANQMSYDSPQIMLDSIDKVWNEPVEIHLGNHPYNNKTFEKREKQLREGGNPFINTESWHEFLTDLKGKIRAKIALNEEMEKEMKALGL